MQYKNLQELKDYIVSRGGVATIHMKDIKDAAQQGESLKKFVREKITKELQQFGLTHNGELPNSQFTTVRVYQSGTAVAAIIEAALTMDGGEKYDQILRSAALNDPTKTTDELESLREESALLDKIRDILQCPEG